MASTAEENREENLECSAVNDAKNKILSMVEKEPESFKEKALKLTCNDVFVTDMLQKNKNDVEKAVENVRSFLLWAKEMNIANLSWLSFPLEYFKTGGMFTKYGRDVNGNIVIYRIFQNSANLKEIREFNKRVLSFVFTEATEEAYKNNTKISIIYDFTNARLENIDPALGTYLTKVCDEYVPDSILTLALFYNLNWLVKPIIKMLLLAAPSRMKSKFQFASGDEILKYVDEKNLAPFIRDSTKNCLEVPEGAKSIDEIDLNAIGIQSEDKDKIKAVFGKYQKP
ncbi:motile sperm domain-containing protein 2-like protein [Leptotrombidium deliense]|uniref:Motile sperm domain-containing protein 2-like protein n=1 Tax=Leptotrombidium deliense TaxID=299467 RepID=A0A443S2G1_9ACAR|nr:motile sperm domain-containing protein 2-like protein [Leptotrombidium deliense]